MAVVEALIKDRLEATLSAWVGYGRSGDTKTLVTSSVQGSGDAQGMVQVSSPSESKHNCSHRDLCPVQQDEPKSAP